MNASSSLERPVADRTRKARGAGHERIEEILIAARDLFVTHGIERVSTRQIARAVGLSQTGLYVYFPTKDALLNAVMNRAFQGLDAVICDVALDPDDAGASLRRLLRALVHFGLDHGQEYQIAFLLSGKPVARKNDEVVLNEAGMRAFGSLCAFVAQAQACGSMSSDLGTPESAAQIIWAAAHGVIALLLLQPHFPWVSLDELIATQGILITTGALTRESHHS